MIRRLLMLLPLVAVLALTGCATTSNGEYSSLPPSARHAPKPNAGEPEGQPPPPVEAVPDLPPEAFSDLLDRVRAGYAIQDVQSYAVDREVEGYRTKPDFLDRTFKRGSRYLYYIVTELERRGMPLELALLPVVESAFNPVAYSRSRAAGLWQFIPSTGKHYGLKQNWWVDERRDVLRSTNAALDYLEKLHDYFNGDWYLAIAAYNGGEGTVSAAVQRNANAGLPTDFWSLDLRPETRDYVPKLLAIRRIVGDPAAFGLNFAPIPNTPYFGIVDPGRQVDLGRAAELAGISRDDMFALNPAFNRMTTPPDGPFQLLLPVGNVEQFQAAISTEAGAAQVAAVAVEPPPFRKHYVQRGETLSSIARKYDVEVGTIKAANGIRGTTIHPGDTLRIPGAATDTDDADVAASRTDILAQLPERQPGGGVTTASQGSKASKAAARATKTHVVKPGDTLWGVAHRYDVTVPALAAANDLSPKSALSVGTRLDIPAGGGSGGTRESSRMTYEVRSGDTLTRIADRFNVSVSDLAGWNGLTKSQTLRTGQRLVVYSDPQRVDGG
ncbi:MAG: LysM peptidoglycan-binding domain-containing protein [Steroidobacteraceae bacterium]